MTQEMSPSNRRTVGFAFVLLAAISWSLAGIGIKSVPLTSLAIVGWRSLLALPVFVLVLFGRTASATGPALRLALVRPATWAAALVYTWTMLSFVLASKWTTAANAILLQYTAPIYVVLLSWPLLREKVTGADILAVMGCFAGIVWFFLGQISTTGLYGNLLALSSGLGLGLLPLLLRRAERPAPSTSPRDKTLLPFMPTCVLLLGNVLAFFCGLPAMATARVTGASVWVWLFLLGVVQVALAYLFYAAAVRRLRPVECLMVATLEPILNPLWVALGTGERPSRTAVIGGVLIVFSVVSHGIYVGLGKADKFSPSAPV